MILAILLAFQIVSTTLNIYSLLSVHFNYEDIENGPYAGWDIWSDCIKSSIHPHYSLEKVKEWNINIKQTVYVFERFDATHLIKFVEIVKSSYFILKSTLI